MRKVLILFVLLLLSLVAIYSYLFYFRKGIISENLTTKTTNANYRSRINCSDIRKVIEDGGKKYIACYGGVLVLDNASGNIEKQISMANGLSHFTTTDLVKKNNYLYIGTQDGITVWDLLRDKATKLSVKEGLPNAANIILEEDGDYIWIGTFNGLARLDTKNDKLQIFTKEILTQEGERLNVNGIAVTNNYVYFSITASAHSRGLVARFNKNTGEWKKYETADFGDTSEYARLDAFGMCSTKDAVFFMEDKTLWKIQLTESAQPEKVFTAGYNDSIDWNILCDSNSVLFKTHDKKLVYENNITKEFDQSAHYKIGEKLKNREDSTNYEKVFGKEFFGTFSSILGTIDDKVLLASSNGFWLADTSKDLLTKISMPENFEPDLSQNSSLFWPVAGTDQFVLAEQTCGMGCDSPKFYICSFPNNQCKTLNISAEAMKVIAPAETAIGMDYGYVDLLSSAQKSINSLTFRVALMEKISYISLKSDGLQWEVGKKDPLQDSKITGCTENHTYKLSMGKILTEKDICLSQDGTVLLNDWFYTFSTDTFASRLNRKTETWESLKPEMSPAGYTPFEAIEWATPQINKLVSSGNKVYYCTTRGLWIFDAIENTWDLISTEDGLPSNDVKDFTLTGNNIFVLTAAGITTISLN